MVCTTGNTGLQLPLTTHYSLLTTHYSLLTTHYSLLTTHYSPGRYSHPFRIHGAADEAGRALGDHEGRNGGEQSLVRPMRLERAPELARIHEGADALPDAAGEVDGGSLEHQRDVAGKAAEQAHEQRDGGARRFVVFSRARKNCFRGERLRLRVERPVQ